MLNRPIGKITREEKNEIKAMYYRSKSNKNLLMTLQDKESMQYNIDLYQKVHTEDELINDKMHEWWCAMAANYKWNGNSWYVDFVTNEIFVYE